MRIAQAFAPARMRQQPEIDQGLVHAQADTITYWQRAQKVNLTSNARIEQRGDVVTGDLIIYFIEKQLVKAESGKREDGNRVNVIIQPSTQQGERKIEPAGTAAPEATEEVENRTLTTALAPSCSAWDFIRSMASSRRVRASWSPLRTATPVSRPATTGSTSSGPKTTSAATSPRPT